MTGPVYDLFWDEERLSLISRNRVMPEMGPPQLAKAIYRRLITYPGELPAHPDYGSRLKDYVGRTNDTWAVKLMALEAKTAVLADPRIAEARVEAEEIRDGCVLLTIYATPKPGLGYDEIVVRIEVGPGGIAYAD